MGNNLFFKIIVSRDNFSLLAIIHVGRMSLKSGIRTSTIKPGVANSEPILKPRVTYVYGLWYLCDSWRRHSPRRWRRSTATTLWVSTILMRLSTRFPKSVVNSSWAFTNVSIFTEIPRVFPLHATKISQFGSQEWFMNRTTLPVLNSSMNAIRCSSASGGVGPTLDSSVVQRARYFEDRVEGSKLTRDFSNDGIGA
ncbi:hypothetical protein K469DRAFT_683676 [Zopfia rhizophila CBS 207.26]|uniref:Uncharacterized protein n=1 Tax=Zopfia rhizophila CBS 207.26 TaxID=1314779 RepID=A0A6A6EDE7_9PEZI|nr:hypothetical protein K469DRAFT_683676 [Zopfia rhizophila CBS 207.26]